MKQSRPVLLVLVDVKTKTNVSSKISLFCTKTSKIIQVNPSIICSTWFCNRSDSKLLSVVGINTPKKDNTPLLQCTHHMCPIRVHWHVKANYKDYWRSKVAITNFNYRMNYTQWTLVVQHPNLNNVTQVFSFDYKPLVPYGSISTFLDLLST